MAIQHDIQELTNTANNMGLLERVFVHVYTSTPQDVEFPRGGFHVHYAMPLRAWPIHLEHSGAFCSRDEQLLPCDPLAAGCQPSLYHKYG